LALAPTGTFEFDIETKSFPDRPELTPTPERFAELVLAAIRRHNVESRVNLFSFDFRVLKAMQKLAPLIRRCALYEGPPKSFVEIAREAGDVLLVAPHHSLVTPDLVVEAHRAHLRVLPWTANSPADWERLLASKVDAIITDDPEALFAFLCHNA
jgi:glycerophosphoryl diester phosphodiesterase